MTRFLLILCTTLAFSFGGWHWALFFAFAAVWLQYEQSRVWLGVFVWLAAYVWTGDRRLYFPFVIPVIVLVWGWQSVRGGLALAALFAGIRIAQGASAKVLLVELLVSIFAICLPLWMGQQGDAPGLRWACATAGSLLAFAGLIF